MTVREPEYTDQDREELLALAHHRASLCPNGCGQPLAESTSHYSAGPEYDTKRNTCRACAALGEAQRAEAERSGGKGNSRAVVWSIEKLKG